MLRLNVPRLALQSVVMPAVPKFLADNPDASVDIAIDDALVDIVAAGYDAGIRLQEALSDGMMATRLGTRFRFVLVAAPGYLKRRGRPASVADLKEHDGIGMRFPNGTLYRWEVEVGGREVTVAVRGRVVVQGMVAALEAARLGLGVAYVDEPTAAPALKSRELEVVLPQAAASVPGLFLYYPRSMRKDAKIRAFIAACR